MACLPPVGRGCCCRPRLEIGAFRRREVGPRERAVLAETPDMLATVVAAGGLVGVDHVVPGDREAAPAQFRPIAAHSRFIFAPMIPTPMTEDLLLASWELIQPFGRRVDVLANLERMRVRADGGIVAGHPRIWARRGTATDRERVETAAQLRSSSPAPPLREGAI